MGDNSGQVGQPIQDGGLHFLGRARLKVGTA